MKKNKIGQYGESWSKGEQLFLARADFSNS